MGSFKVVGADKAAGKLEKISKAVKDLTPALRDSGEVVIQEFKANFPAKGEVLEKPWAPRKYFYPWPILQKTGKLRSTWKKKAKKDELRVENPVSYAKYHHFGTTKLPVRALVNDAKNIKKIILDRITKYIKSFF